MNICIIGDGLTSLSLAKNFINKKINVHIYYENTVGSFSSNRTIGMSKTNLEFFEKNIIKIPKKIKWEIKKIEIYSEKLKKDKILNFENNNTNLFYMIKNNELYKLLNDKLLKNKLFKKKKINHKLFYDKLLKINNYDLIINCNQNNPISKKYFIQKIEKDYKNFAYTTILEHKKLNNNSAVQVFTNFGPVAFLPISNTKTSVVCSLDTMNKNYNDIEILELINKYNPKFEIKKNSKFVSFPLKSSNLKKYYHANILAFGELLHKIHPLAGQGFNMTIRDIKDLSEIIENKLDLGLQFDSSILKEFQIKTQSRNFIFSSGIDFIYELFNFDKKREGKNINKILQYLGSNKNFINSIIKFADKGIAI
jgi:2-octaprenyl-6-methoxyphenol hydroxylase